MVTGWSETARCLGAASKLLNPKSLLRKIYCPASNKLSARADQIDQPPILNDSRMTVYSPARVLPHGKQSVTFAQNAELKKPGKENILHRVDVVSTQRHVDPRAHVGTFVESRGSFVSKT